MYFEYCNYNKYIYDYGKELTHIFGAVDKGLGGLALPIHLIREVKEYMPAGTVLATAIDYPSGYSSPKTRSHAVLTALKSNVTAIDYVPNQYFVRNKFTEVSEEVKTALAMCKDYGATLRVFLDYHHISNIITFSRQLEKLGVEIVFPTLGYHHDDFFDNLLNAKMVEKQTSLSVIFNGYMWTPEHMEIIKKSKLFGARLYNLSLWCKYKQEQDL